MNYCSECGHKLEHKAEYNQVILMKKVLRKIYFMLGPLLEELGTVTDYEGELKALGDIIRFRMTPYSAVAVTSIQFSDAKVIGAIQLTKVPDVSGCDNKELEELARDKALDLFITLSWMLARDKCKVFACQMVYKNNTWKLIHT